MGEIISAQILWAKSNGYNVTHAKMLKKNYGFHEFYFDSNKENLKSFGQC